MFDGKAFGQEIVGMVTGYLEKQTAPLLNRIDELERKLAAMETRGLKYAGVHQRACDYERGSVVTADGSAWVAIVDTKAGDAPGTSSSWQLLVKRGKDGRDARP